MIRKALEVGPPETSVSHVKMARVLGQQIENFFQLRTELPGKLIRNGFVILKGLLDISLDKRVEDYFHPVRIKAGRSTPKIL